MGGEKRCGLKKKSQRGGVYTPAHPGVPVPPPQPGMLSPSPPVEAAVGRLSAITAAKSSSLSASAAAETGGPARPLWAAGGPQQNKTGAAPPGAEQPRLPQTWGARPAPPRHPPNPHPRREDPASRGRGVQAAPGSAGPAGDPERSPRSVGPRRDLSCAPLGVRAVGRMRSPPPRSYLGEPCGDGSSETLNFIHRVQELLSFTHRFWRQGAEFVKT